MHYLVTGEYVETGALLPPPQVSQMIEHTIIPSLEALAKLQKDGKILAGGIIVGARAGVFVLEAASHEEVTRTLLALPFWGLLKWDVTPLESFSHRASFERELLASARK
jgi:muconolactone delta-isomerase